MKTGKYEKVTKRGAARLDTLRVVLAVCRDVMTDGGAASIRKERARRLIIRIDTSLMEHRIYARTAPAPISKAEIFGMIDRHMAAPRPCFGPGRAEYKTIPLADIPAALADGDWYLVSNVCVFEATAQVYREKPSSVIFR
jgi:hypothetical protein